MRMIIRLLLEIILLMIAGDVSVVFTDEFMQQADKGLCKGNFTFSAEIKNTVTDEVVKITVPGTTIEKEIHVNRDVNLYTEKSASYDEKTGEINNIQL